MTRELLAAGGSSRLTDTVALTPEAVVAAAHGGDALAQAALAQVGRWLGIVMAARTAVVNPRKIVVGGGLGLAAADVLLPAATRELQRRVVPGRYDRMDVVRSPLKSSAVGAAWLVWWSAEGASAQGGAMQGN